MRTEQLVEGGTFTAAVAVSAIIGVSFVQLLSLESFL